MNSKGIKVTLHTEADIPTATNVIADHYWNEVLPIFSLTRDEKWAELERLRKYDHTRLIQQDEDGGTLIGQSMHGLALAWNYHPHAWDIECADRRTPLDTFCNRRVLERVIEQILTRILKKHGGRGIFTDNLLRKHLRDFTGSHGVSNFRPTAAAAIYELYMPPEGGVSWDMSSGFGGRLLGAITCKRVKKYVGSDPASETIAGLHEMASEVLPMARQRGRELEFELHMLGSETNEMRDALPEGSVDLCWTSPPYYAQEHYSDEETQSYIRFPDQKSWLEGYLGSTLDNCAYCLKPNGTLAVNIADVDSYEGSLTDDFVALAEQRGWERVETLKLALSRGRGAKHRGKYKYEPIFVFRRQGE